MYLKFKSLGANLSFVTDCFIVSKICNSIQGHNLLMCKVRFNKGCPALLTLQGCFDEQLKKYFPDSTEKYAIIRHQQVSATGTATPSST